MLHKFRNHIISRETEILLLGTFHPDIDTGADFFYERPRNYLWTILPACFGYRDLKSSNLEDKRIFMNKFSVDFVDIIQSLKIHQQGEKCNYRDDFIDQFIENWENITHLIDTLPKLESVYFTRCNFTRIPNIETKIAEIRNHCVERSLRFCLLETPARYTNERKIKMWSNTIIHKQTCN